MGWRSPTLVNSGLKLLLLRFSNGIVGKICLIGELIKLSLVKCFFPTISKRAPPETTNFEILSKYFGGRIPCSPYWSKIIKLNLDISAAKSSCVGKGISDNSDKW